MGKMADILAAKGMKIPEKKEGLSEAEKVAAQKLIDDKKLIDTNISEAEKAAAQKVIDDQKLIDDNKKKETDDQFDWTKVPEKVLFDYLTEKAERDIKGFDDLHVTEVEKLVEKLVEVELNSEVGAFKKFNDETKRGMKDFMKTQKDWSKEEDKDYVLREYLADTNPDLSKDSLDFMMEDDFSIPEKLDAENDNYTADDLRKNDRAIKRATLDRQLAIGEAIRHFEASKAKYLILKDDGSGAAAKAEAAQLVWTQDVNSTMESQTGLEHGEFKYEFKDVDTFKESASSLDGLLGRYKGADGKLDVAKLLKVIRSGEQVDGILTDHASHIEAAVRTELLGEKANLGDKKFDPNKKIINQDPDKVALAKEAHLLTLKGMGGKTMKSNRRQ